ncbi:MAG: hypothetical protein M9890_01955 [Thermomicrobiales bacterium]|nr:hypothetical protein [Thermomicrobiales bacterium]
MQHFVRHITHASIRYYAALRLAAGSMLDIVPADGMPDRPPIVRRSENELPSGFDRRELIERNGVSHVVTLTAQVERKALDISLN